MKESNFSIETEIIYIGAEPGSEFPEVADDIISICKEKDHTVIYILEFNSSTYYIDKNTDKDFLRQLFYYKKKEEKYITNLKSER